MTLRNVQKVLLFIPIGGAALLAYGLTILGLVQIGYGALDLLLDSSSERHAIGKIFRGLDLLFVSPMAILIIYALYLLAEATLAPEKYAEAKERLTDAKAFILGLLATAVAVHFVENVLTGQSNGVIDPLVYGVTILIIGGYGLLLDRISTAHN